MPDQLRPATEYFRVPRVTSLSSSSKGSRANTDFDEGRQEHPWPGPHGVTIHVHQGSYPSGLFSQCRMEARGPYSRQQFRKRLTVHQGRAVTEELQPLECKLLVPQSNSVVSDNRYLASHEAVPSEATLRAHPGMRSQIVTCVLDR